jgi:2-keto-4-pentenoate hydratase/2-oxohepta-3-ene-1,7-dioic acid hydratase in catechol pathway
MGPNDPVVMPPQSRKSDWEVELGIIIGQEARYVPLERALDFVAGVCVCNDLSERHFQTERGGQWDKGKGCDTFGPFGPYLVTLDEAGDLDSLHLWLDVNGERMQNGSTGDMIFNVPFLVHYVSQFMSLQPGDIISTGTPAGVGMGRNPPVFLQEGDEIHLGVDGLGEQRQQVRRYPAP